VSVGVAIDSKHCRRRISGVSKEPLFVAVYFEPWMLRVEISTMEI
jgi:hypothetical protein